MKVSIECPACAGAGGSVEPVCDDGSGPYEPCGFCGGKGRIKLWRVSDIYWAFSTAIDDKKRSKARRKKYISEYKKRAAISRTEGGKVGGMSKHTPGPWKAVEDIFNERPEIRDKDGRRVCVVVADFPMGNSFMDCNARLIAAAPDLADVAHMVLESVADDTRLFKAATAALRKAGEIQ